MYILIAEDEPSLRENLQFLLEMEGYSVQAASDGRSALEAALRAPPDLLITDVMMPHMDGHELVRQLRSNALTALLPIIMLSARLEHKDVRLGMTLGADDYLFKPYQRDELLEAVVARLARLSQQRAMQRGIEALGHAATLRDPLTGLLTREKFEAGLHTVMAHAQTLDSDRATLICLGLDYFEKVIDSLGKAMSELALKAVAERIALLCAPGAPLAPCAQGSLVMGRLGWDQFAIAFKANLDAYTIQQLARGVQDAIAQPLVVQDSTLFLTACVGAALQDAPSMPAASLMHHAESALAHARGQGAARFRLFDVSDTLQAARSLQIHNGLHQALAHGGFQLVYQPQVCTQSGRLVGFEALMRWRHPVLGWISPAEFIPAAEHGNLIARMGEWVLRTAARQAAEWIAQGHSGFRVAVNLSAAQLEGHALPALVQSVLQEAGVPASYLELEITESMAMHNVPQTLSNLHACKALGVTLAMDDFGTGYSSLAYLKRFPLDALKIDQSFVRNITEDAGDAAITRAVVGLAHSFGMSVVAEGVETLAQLEFLRALGCQVFQGYLFSKPVPALEAALCFTGYAATARHGASALG
jgi:diguanylate cyclase (GGDEF)-like protein